MKFHKDILVLNFEQSKYLPVQVAAILLDKETLQEKSSFYSYIFADIGDYVNSKSGITQDMIQGAPKQSEVAEMLYQKFGTDVFLASFVQNMDITFFSEMMRKASIDFIDGRTDFKKYDFHILDIWPVAYVYALKNGYTGSTRSEELFQFYNAKPRGLHDALEDCRITADVLRKIVS